MHGCNNEVHGNYGGHVQGPTGLKIKMSRQYILVRKINGGCFED